MNRQKPSGKLDAIKNKNVAVRDQDAAGRSARVVVPRLRRVRTSGGGRAAFKGWRTHLIVLLGGHAALRAGEMVALHWSDVDFARRRLCVRHSDWRPTESSVSVDPRAAGREARRRSDGRSHPGHTFCSHLAMQGAPSIAIQGLAGLRFSCWSRAPGVGSVETLWRRPPRKTELEAGQSVKWLGVRDDFRNWLVTAA